MLGTIDKSVGKKVEEVVRQALQEAAAVDVEVCGEREAEHLGAGQAWTGPASVLGAAWFLCQENCLYFVSICWDSEASFHMESTSASSFFPGAA